MTGTTHETADAQRDGLPPAKANTADDDPRARAANPPRGDAEAVDEIDRYMQELLDRINGRSQQGSGHRGSEGEDRPRPSAPQPSAPPTPAAPEPSAHSAPVPPAGESRPSADDLRRPAAGAAPPAAAPPAAAPKPAPQRPAAAPRPKAPPERASDLAAMRDLANQSAGAALSRADASRLAATAAGKLLVAGAGLCAAALLLLISDLSSWLATASMALAVAVAVLWCGQAAVLGMRAARHRQAAHRPEEDPDAPAPASPHGGP